MADKTKEQLQAELEALQVQLATANEEKETLRNAMDSKKFVGEVIEGTFTASLKDGSGKTVKKTFGFKRGHKYLMIKGKKMLTTAVIQMANGKDVDKDVLKNNPQLLDLSNAEAATHLTYLAKIGYAFLEEKE